jgi:serine/threonine-protein kinase
MTMPTSLTDGRYLLVSPLGEGGMATVYRGYDQRLQVWRAVKILAPQYASKPKLRSRFEAEAQTMALLEHRNIVRVYDVGHDGPYAYIVMELVEGGSLVEWLERNGAMPPRMAVDVILQLCDGIEAAHTKGVVHRDIKPHNVLITPKGVCRVTDFGIARVEDKTHDGMTKTGAVMGTWGYMAPEQRTDSKHVDERADVYAIACTLYTLLTDKSPMDLFAADPNDPDMRSMPTGMAELILKAAEYKREDRFQSVSEFTEALMELRLSLPANPPDTPPLAREPGEVPPTPDPADFEGPGAAPEGTEWFGGTIAPEGDILPDSPPTLAPGTGFETTGVGSLGATAIPTATPIPGGVVPETVVARRGVSLGVIAAALIGLLGVGLAGTAVGLVVYTNLDGGSGLFQSEPTEPAPDPTPPEPTQEEPAEEDSAAPPDPAPEPEPVAVAPTPKPRPSPRPVSPTPRPAPEPAVAVVPEPEPPPVVVIRPVEPEPAPVPAVRQCIKVTPPAPTGVGYEAIFRAKLCSEDGSDVILWYRPMGGGQWESVLMPKILGTHVAKVAVDPRFSEGMEYYVQNGSITEGSRTNPKYVDVN